MMSTVAIKSKVEISKRLVFINSASSLVTRLLSISVLIWLQQYLLKRITAEEYSLLPVLYSVMMFAPLITTILTGGLGRYIVEAYAKDDDKRVTQIVSTMFPILCAAGFVFLAGGWTLAWYIGSVLNIAPERLWDARIMMAMLMFSAAVRLPLAPFGVGLYVRQKFVLQNLIGVGTEIFRLTLLFTLVLGVSTRVLWVVTAAVTADLLNLAITQAISRRLVPSLRFNLPSRNWSVAREITGFGGWSFVSSLGETIRTGADPIVLNKLATAHDVTCFYVGGMVQRELQGILGTMLAPFSPALTAIYATGDMARLRAVFLRGGRIAMLGGLLIVLPLIVFRRPLIELYVGSRYMAASVVMALLLGQSLFYWGNILFSPIAYASGRIRALSAVSTGMNFVNLMLTFYLVGYLRMGAVGSALATFCASTALWSLFISPMAIRFLGIRVSQCWHEAWLPGGLPSLISVPVWILLQETIYPSTWLMLGLEWLLGCVVYVIAAASLSLKQADWRDMRHLASSARGFLGQRRERVASTVGCSALTRRS